MSSRGPFFFTIRDGMQGTELATRTPLTDAARNKLPQQILRNKFHIRCAYFTPNCTWSLNYSVLVIFYRQNQLFHG
jgi:hypothetical protein